MKRLTLALWALIGVGLTACGGDEAADDAVPDQNDQVVQAASVQLEAPRQVPAGAPVEVTWSGPDEPNDYIAVAEEGSDDNAYVDYTRTRRGNPLTVRVPDTPGSFELRYVSAENDQVLVRAPLTVLDVDASLEIPAQIGAGAPLEVTWTGPDNPNDYISLAEPGSDDATYVDYTRTRRGNPLTVRAPDTAGSFEVRYVMSQADRVLARELVEVIPVDASFEVRETLMVDTPAEIHWTGPDNPNDYVSIAERGSPPDAYVTYQRTRRGNPMTLRTPEQPGQYELRYVMAQSDRVLATHPLTIMPLTATLQAPETAGAGEGLEVEWIGPDGPDDFIAVASPDASATEYESRALSRAGSPASLFVPSTPGSYELRYIWAEADSILVRRPLVVQER